MDEAEKRAKRAAYMREWVAKHPEYREYQREYQRVYKSDPEKREVARQRASAWYAANRERALEWHRAHNAAKPKKGRPTGEAHHNWKGEAVGYHALHLWVVKQKGAPSQCEHCGTTTARRFEWANVDHKYSRELTDWVRLCTSCHRRHDYDKGLSLKGGRRRKE